MTPEDHADKIGIKADELNKLIAEACVDHPHLKVELFTTDVRSAVSRYPRPAVRVEISVVL